MQDERTGNGHHLPSPTSTGREGEGRVCCFFRQQQSALVPSWLPWHCMVPESPFSWINPSAHSKTPRMGFLARLLVRAGTESLSASYLILCFFQLPPHPPSCLVSAHSPIRIPSISISLASTFLAYSLFGDLALSAHGLVPSLPDSTHSSGYASIVDIMFDSPTHPH